MKTRIIRIGNSHGIRIPKPVLELVGLTHEAELTVQNGTLVVRSADNPRKGWAESFRKMAERGDDAPVDGDLPSLSSWDEEEWEW